MRHLPVVLLLALPIVVCAADPVRSITVHGRARDLVSADRFVINASVTVVKPRLEEAQQGEEAVLDKTLQALAKAGLPKPVVNDRQFGRRTHWNSQTQEQVQDGFFSSVTMELTLDAKAKLDAALAALVQSDDVAVSGVSYQAQRAIELRQGVRRRALLAAKEKAADMAATLGAELGPVMTVSEATPATCWTATNSFNDNRAPTNPDEARLAEGMVEIASDVDVSFALK